MNLILDNRTYACGFKSHYFITSYIFKCRFSLDSKVMFIASVKTMLLYHHDLAKIGRDFYSMATRICVGNRSLSVS